MHTFPRRRLLLRLLGLGLWLCAEANAAVAASLRYCSGELLVVEVGKSVRTVGCVGPLGEILPLGSHQKCANFVVERGGGFGGLYIGNEAEKEPSQGGGAKYLDVALSADNRLNTRISKKDFLAQNLEWNDAAMPLPKEWNGAAEALKTNYGGRLVRARDRDPRFSAVRGLEAAPELDFLFSNSLGSLAIVCPLKTGEAAR